MDNQTSTAPTKQEPRASGEWRLLRLYPSTWLVLLLTAGLMFLVEFPARRASVTCYQHGWPMVWLERASGYSADPSPRDDPFLSGWKRPPDFRIRHANEERMDPWTICLATSTPGFAVDIWFAAAVILVAAWIFQRWRRRHGSLLRFRLRTALLFTASVATVVAPVAFWNRERQDELSVIEALKTAGISANIHVAWFPPTWLPESLAKIALIRPLFDKVEWIATGGGQFTDVNIAPLERLAHLQSLQIEPGQINDAGFTALGRLSGLKYLYLDESRITDQQIEQLARLSQLEDLSLENAEVSNAGLVSLSRLRNLRSLSIFVPNLSSEGLDALRNLSKLESLTLQSIAFSDDAAQSIEQLKFLRSLTLNGTTLQNFRMAGMPELRSVCLSENRRLESVDLRALPALVNTAVEYRGSRGPALKLNLAPSTRFVQLEGVVLNSVAVDEIMRAPNLGQLILRNVQFSGRTRLDIKSPSCVWCIQVENSDLSEIHVADARALSHFICLRDPKLTSIRLEHLPDLSFLDLEDCPLLNDVDLREMKGLARLQVYLNLSDDANVSASRSVRLQIGGLSEVTSLAPLTIKHAGPISADSLTDLSKLHELNWLTLQSESLRDDDLSYLARLSALNWLDLSYCNIGGEGLTSLRPLPALARLDLSHTPVSDEAVAEFLRAKPNMAVNYEPKKPAMDDLRRQVALVRNRLSTEIACKVSPEKLADRDFECLAALDNLNSLDLSGTHLTDAGLEYLRRLPRLHDLVLRRTQVTDAAVRLLRQIPELQHVDIEETRITDEGRRALGPLIAKQPRTDQGN
jgi:Leucine-rich repeat (LRR) protein